MTDLQKFEGRFGVLRFMDGHAVKARLVHVDTDDREEVIYDILEVITPWASELGDVKAGTTAIGSLADIVDFEVLDDTA